MEYPSNRTTPTSLPRAINQTAAATKKGGGEGHQGVVNPTPPPLGRPTAASETLPPSPELLTKLAQGLYATFDTRWGQQLGFRDSLESLCSDIVIYKPP